MWFGLSVAFSLSHGRQVGLEAETCTGFELLWKYLHMSKRMDKSVNPSVRTTRLDPGEYDDKTLGTDMGG